MVRRTLLCAGLLLLAGCGDGAGPRHGLVFTQVSGGWWSRCAVAAGGALYCWGENQEGQLGIGSRTGREVCSSPSGTVPCSTRPVRVSSTLMFTDVTVGANPYACGITTAGSAYCWGANVVGELGTGDTVSTPTPARVAGGLAFALVRAGARHTCGLTTSGAAYCWGLNHRGQLGNDDTTDSYVPVAVAGGLAFVGLSLGLDDACGVTADGAAYCWGNGGDGQLGNGTNTNSWVPAPVSGGLRFSVVSTGLLHTCGVTTSGAAYCWGTNFAGELGTGDTSFTNRPVPVASRLTFPVERELTFATISAGSWYTCGVTTDGAAYCWGWNNWGQAGIGGIGYAVYTPTAVIGGLSFASIRAGNYGTCGLTREGAVYCWGDNYVGELGDGTTVFSSGPMRVIDP